MARLQVGEKMRNLKKVFTIFRNLKLKSKEFQSLTTKFTREEKVLLRTLKSVATFRAKITKPPNVNRRRKISDLRCESPDPAAESRTLTKVSTLTSNSISIFFDDYLKRTFWDSIPHLHFQNSLVLKCLKCLSNVSSKNAWISFIDFLIFFNPAEILYPATTHGSDWMTSSVKT